MSSAQSNLEHTLERQSSLEDLAVGLVKKSEDLERIMRSFEDLVGKALDKAEGRTLESTDKIRSAISEVVDSATKRFAEATEDMRRSAGSIKTDLESTRAELRKGVLDMPQEAKESTTAIRRAVSEQIKALKELSEIVAKSGRTVDVSDNRPPVAPAPAAAPSRAAAGPARCRRPSRCAARSTPLPQLAPSGGSARQDRWLGSRPPDRRFARGGRGRRRGRRSAPRRHPGRVRRPMSSNR